MVRVLIVEDSQTEASILTECLRQSGFEAQNVTTAETAKAILEQKSFDAILLDVILPGQSGFSLCRELKNQECTAKIPIIICSIKSGKIDKNWALKQGANAYLTKPINTEEVLSTLTELMKQ
jgi:twitching motility two-component system response regulator PilH/chemotaxis family two-component system response regulator PixH